MLENNRVCVSHHINKNNVWELTRNDSVRKFISSAIYVKEPIIMPPFKKNSAFNNYNGETTCNHRIFKIKRCLCYSNPLNCPCHPKEYTPTTILDKNDNKSLNSSPSTSSTESESQGTVKCGTAIVKSKNTYQLSMTSLLSHTTVENNMKEEALKSWLVKKEEERRKNLLKEMQQKEEKIRLKQLLVEKEKESFKKWLVEKKKDEELKKKQKETELKELQKIVEVEKEKRVLANQLSYNLWVQRKKKLELERKINEKLSFLTFCEEKQKRMEENEIAFQEWLKNSKNKPKPIPLNQGLQSLCSSVSVTYVNPIPWNPNILMDNSIEK